MGFIVGTATSCEQGKKGVRNGFEIPKFFILGNGGRECHFVEFCGGRGREYEGMLKFQNSQIFKNIKKIVEK